jgi:hypothetical protein
MPRACEERVRDVPEFVMNPLEPMLTAPNSEIFSRFHVQFARWDAGTQFTCFPSTKVQILTQKTQPSYSRPWARASTTRTTAYQVYLLY